MTNKRLFGMECDIYITNLGDRIYGCSSLSGYLVQDNVTIEGLVIHDLVFAVVTNELAKTFLYSPCNGLIGTAIDGVVPTFYKIGFQDLVDFVVFSFSAWLAMLLLMKMVS
ncbi:hypothetical protein FF38_03632 [Lucilia cuprina]|uniref:Peptidase A1 domain-containing protein n=1 Tax=Lucilia cuprina TaxID=7375 RepID=A0A0L0CLC5_LUCCU|nr:hypothetical protein FF38_03632 [Lucilia cuprina]